MKWFCALKPDPAAPIQTQIESWVKEDDHSKKVVKNGKGSLSWSQTSYQLKAKG